MARNEFGFDPACAAFASRAEEKAHLVRELARIEASALDTCALLETDESRDLDAAIESAERAIRARLRKLSTEKLWERYQERAG
jgi:ribosome-associated translation inhibitor RaiA